MIEAFRALFGSAGGMRVCRAPGRVNLIGEHTDYNLGFVLPMALDLAICIAAAPSADGKLRVYSEHRREMREWTAAGLAALEPAGDWSDYPAGVARELVRGGFPVAGANLLIRSTVPEGAGLSSSAALEVAAALALLDGRAMAPLDLARLCQRAEREFVGMPCGIMDQYISVHGRGGAAIEIDCRSLEHRVVALPAAATFMAVNTMVKHALAAGSAYKDRVRECAASAAALGVASLRDVTPDQLASASPRARHVVTENQRVHAFVEAAAAGNLARMGELLIESHHSLQYDYEVSCVELDFLAETALEIDGVLGARMTGGGFGGCIVAMLRPEAAARFAAEIARAYQDRFHVVPAIYPCRPSEGASELKTPGKQSLKPSVA